MPRPRPNGFSLLETLLALLLIGVVLLFTLGILQLSPGVERRIAAHRDALNALESTLESLRADAAFPAEGPVDVAGLPLSTDSAAQNLRIFAEVEILPGRSLRRVKLTARYEVFGRTFERDLETMVFSP